MEQPNAAMQQQQQQQPTSSATGSVGGGVQGQGEGKGGGSGGWGLFRNTPFSPKPEQPTTAAQAADAVASSGMMPSAGLDHNQAFSLPDSYPGPEGSGGLAGVSSRKVMGMGGMSSALGLSAATAGTTSTAMTGQGNISTLPSTQNVDAVRAERPAEWTKYFDKGTQRDYWSNGTESVSDCAGCAWYVDYAL